jgi:Ca-activated chloride channel family protein
MNTEYEADKFEPTPRRRSRSRRGLLVAAAVAILLPLGSVLAWVGYQSSGGAPPAPQGKPPVSDQSLGPGSLPAGGTATPGGPSSGGDAQPVAPAQPAAPAEPAVSSPAEPVPDTNTDDTGLAAIRQAIAEAGSPTGSGATALGGSGPGGKITIGIAYGTEKRHWLQWAVEEFARRSEGQTVQVDLIPMGSMEGAHAILDRDERIHVWAPASKMYLNTFLRDWEAKYQGNPIVRGEDLALTPMVIVMWRERYDAFMIKAPEVSLKILGYGMNAKTGWGAIAGKPEWGHFKFGHTHPNQSNSGLMTLVLLAYGYHQKRSGLTVSDVMSRDFQDYLAWFERGVTGLSNSTGNMMREMIYKGPVSFDGLMVYESVAIDYFKKAEGRWGQLHVVYPDYNIWNDNPYYILDTPWTTEAHQRAAGVFLEFLMSEPIQARALDHGFRPGNTSVPIRGPGSPFVKYAQFGLKIELPAVCDPPSAEVIDNLQQSWIRSAVRR